MRALGSLCATLALLGGIVIPSGAEAAANAGSATTPTVVYYPCMQADSIRLPDDQPVDALPSPQVLARLQATMHPNGLRCGVVRGGTGSDHAAAVAQMQQVLATANSAAIAAQAIVPAVSCTNADYVTSYSEINVVTGTNVNVNVKYRVNSGIAPCTHNIYWNYIYFASGSGPLWWQASLDCPPQGSNNGSCVSNGSGGSGNGNALPYQANFSNPSTNSTSGTFTGTEFYCTAQGVFSCNNTTTSGNVFYMRTQ